MTFRAIGGLIDGALRAVGTFRAWSARPTTLRDWWRLLPGDLLGIVVMRGLGIASHNRVHDAGDVRAFVVEDERVGRWFGLHLIPTRAQTLGHFVFARNRIDPETMVHECEHIRQWQRFGPFYLPAYFASSAAALMRDGKPYWDNSFEVAARRRATLESWGNAASPAVERDAGDR